LAFFIFAMAWALDGNAAETAVDLELVLAVDASGSVSDREYQLQLAGIARGFRDPAVRKAIRSGPEKAIAVNLLVWAEPQVPKDTTGWFVITGDADAESFARIVEAFPRRQTGATAIGEGIAAALRSIDANSIKGEREVVDVSGDGRESVAREFTVLVDQARAMALARGVIVNGLAIQNEVGDLADYYRRNIQAGPESFVMAAKDYEDFAEAMRRKLLREIEYRPRITQRFMDIEVMMNGVTCRSRLQYPNLPMDFHTQEKTMKQRKLGADLTVSAIGLGCMGMTYAYGGQEEAKSIETLRRAVDLGVTFFDTAEVYGPFDNEILLGKALKGLRDKVVIATKFGFTFDKARSGPSPITGIDSRPQHVKEVADASLKRLGIDTIDLYYQHRVDPKVPIEDTVGAMAELVQAGKVKTLGLSEASAATIRRAHRVHPITAVQSEYSLWTRDPEAEVLATCRELGIGFVPYSPLGRGFLTGAIRDTEALGDNDWRRTQPRFQADTIKANLSMVERLEQIARDNGITAAQLVLAWVLHQGDFIVPIPGVRKIKHLEDNVGAVDVTLSKAELAAIAAAVPKEAVAGKRYTDEGLKLVNA